MKIYKICYALGIFLMAKSSVQAIEPSRQAEIGCLIGHANSSALIFHELPTNEIYIQDDYRNGYSAIYIFKVNGVEVGYAEKGARHGIIYAGKIYPLDSAKRVLKTASTPSEFSPSLALWSTVEDATGKYLCVSFNFDGIGHSGGFQKIKGGYLLSISPVKSGGKLFFMAGNEENYKAGVSR